MREWYLAVFKPEALKDPERFRDHPFRAFESLYAIDNIGPLPADWECRQITGNSLLYYCSREQLTGFLGMYTWWLSPVAGRRRGEKPAGLQKVSLDSLADREKYAILEYRRQAEDLSKYATDYLGTGKRQ